MNNQDRIDLIKEAIEDYHQGKLSLFGCLFAIEIIVNDPRTVTQDEIDQVMQLSEEYLEKQRNIN